MIPGQNAGQAVLNQSLNDRQSADRDFQANLMLDNYVQQRNAEKQMAQEQQNQYYDLINQKADLLLGYDREKVNQRARELHNRVSEKIKFYGGNLQKFMNNGGARMMNRFTGDLLNSPEFSLYRRNKENLARIMDAQQKGYGHLLLQKDVDSMMRYKENKGGEITYNGLMTQLEMPDPNNYDLGQDVPIEDIVGHKENYMKILGNYMMHYPDDQNVTMEDIKAFAYKMGYGIKGSNREKQRFLQKMALKQKQATTKSPKADKRPINALTEIHTVLSQMPAGKTVEEFYDVSGESYANKNFYEELANKNELASNFISQTPWTLMARNVNLDEASFFDIGDKEKTSTPLGVAVKAYDYLFKDMFRLANATRILEGHEKKVAELLFGSKPQEDGTFEIAPTEDMFRMDGVQVTGNEKLEEGAYNSRYTIEGIATGSLTRTSDGKGQLLMTVHDDDGDIDTKQTKKFVDGLAGNEVKPVVLMAVKNEEGNVFYKRMPIDDVTFRSTLLEATGEDFLLNDEVDAQQRRSDEENAARAILDQDQAMYTKYAATVDNALNQNAAFQKETLDFSEPNNPELNRSALMKGWYAVASQFSDPNPLAQNFSFSQMFSPEFVKLNPELAKVKSKLQSFNHSMSDEELIDVWTKAMNKDENADVRARNTFFAEQWKHILKEYNEINS